MTRCASHRNGRIPPKEFKSQFSLPPTPTHFSWETCKKLTHLRCKDDSCTAQLFESRHDRVHFSCAPTSRMKLSRLRVMMGDSAPHNLRIAYSARRIAPSARRSPARAAPKRCASIGRTSEITSGLQRKAYCFLRVESCAAQTSIRPPGAPLFILPSIEQGRSRLRSLAPKRERADGESASQCVCESECL